MIWILCGFYFFGFVGTALYAYHHIWEEIEKRRLRGDKDLGRRQEMYPNIWDDPEIFWASVAWPITLLLIAVFATTAGIGYVLRKLTRPAQVKLRELPDLRQMSKGADES